MVGVEDDHLGGATGLATRLNHVGEGVIAAHEGDRPGRRAAAGELLLAGADSGEVAAGATAPFEEQRLASGEVHDRLHGVFHGVDEAGGALGRRLGTDIEPDRAVERGELIDEQEAQLLLEGDRLLRVQEVTAVAAPAADRVDDATNQLLDGGLALGGVLRAVEILGDDDVDRVLRPRSRHLDIGLFEDHLAGIGGDGARACGPLDLIEGVDTRGAEKPFESGRGFCTVSLRRSSPQPRCPKQTRLRQPLRFHRWCWSSRDSRTPGTTAPTKTGASPLGFFVRPHPHR